MNLIVENDHVRLWVVHTNGFLKFKRAKTVCGDYKLFTFLRRKTNSTLVWKTTKGAELAESALKRPGHSDFVLCNLE